ncbi:WD40 repeat domain-containing serine/threonine protein kinase [Nocardiopsis terrae]
MAGSGDFGWAGEYRLVSRLGAGGMGEVYLARSAGGRAVAVKTVHAHLARDPEFRRRFARESEAAARVGGTFTAPVLDADPEATVPWLATAFVAGPTLTDAVAAAGRLPGGSVRTVGAGLAEALLSIHGAGLTHRDLKPGNVLLSASGPRVIDFGLARAEDATALTDTGQAVGTPGYLPPEVLEGGEAGPAGDVFALGGLLAFAATGRHPYGEGPVVAILRRVLREPPDLAGIEPGLRQLLAACLSADPGARPRADELLVAFGGTGTGGGPAPLPHTVTDLIAEREAWAAERLAEVPYGEPPGQVSGETNPEDEDPGTGPPLARPRRRPSGLSLVVAATVVALVVVAGFLIPRVWSGISDSGARPGSGDPAFAGGLAPPAEGAEPSGGPDEYTLVADHEIDVPLPEGSWHQDLALSPDGGTAYMKGMTTPVLAVDTASGTPLHASEASASGAVTVAPDGALLTVNAIGGSRPREGTWDSAEPVVTIDAGTGETIAETTVGARGGEVAFTPEGQLVVTSPWGGTDLWDTQSGARLRTIAPTGGQRLALSSDGSLVAFLKETVDWKDPGDEPARIEVWTSEGERVAEIDATADSNYGHLSFQPGTTQLTAIGGDAVWMWDAATGDELGGFAHDWGIAPRATIDEGTGRLLAWSLGGGLVSVDLDARVPLGAVAVSEDSARPDLATNTVHVGLSADGSVLVRLGFERPEEDDGPNTYHLYVWERV